jgi:hypothetical protein
LLRCRVSVPASKTDTCPLDLTYTFPPVPTGLQHYSPRALDLTPTLDKLPPAARASLLQTISAYATVQSPATTVQPGERYVNADRQIVRADQPLTATFTQALATGASATSNGCAVLCMPAPDSNPYGAPATQPAPVADFVVDAHVTQGFAYTTASGQPVATDAPISANSAVPNDAVVALTVTWNGAWQVALNGAPRSSSLACLAGAQALQPYTYDARDQYQVYGIVAEIPAANPADGCLFRVIGDGAYAGVPPPTAYLHVLYRFGLLLVLNDANDASFAESSYSFVDVPLANAAETALALQLDATQPYS